MIQYIKNEKHYDLLLDQISKVKHTLWIGTADLKDLYIKKLDTAIPFLALLEQKIKKGVAIRLLHAKEPGENFRKDFDLYPALWNGMELVDEAVQQFDEVWMGMYCKKCGRKDVCKDRIVW